MQYSHDLQKGVRDAFSEECGVIDHLDAGDLSLGVAMQAATASGFRAIDVLQRLANGEATDVYHEARTALKRKELCRQWRQEVYGDDDVDRPVQTIKFRDHARVVSDEGDVSPETLIAYISSGDVGMLITALRSVVDDNGPEAGL